MVLALCLAVGTGTPPLLTATAQVAGATSPTTWYASATGSSSGGCTLAVPCGLQTALADAAAGDTVALTTPGHEAQAATYYTGQFTAATSGTSGPDPVTIEPATGVIDPILSGGDVGTVLTVASGVTLVISGTTVQDGNTSGVGGGINNVNGGNLTLTNDTFVSNSALGAGGAIENGNNGTMTITGSTFTDNSATATTRVPGYGGAIDNGQSYGSGTVTITESTFVGNMSGGDGGAITNGVQYGTGVLTVTNSTFMGNVADGGGSSIENGSHRGSGTVTVGGDIFADSSACSLGDVSDGHPHIWTDDGYNVGEDTSCAGGSLVLTDNDTAGSGLPGLLGSLGNNGGLTQTVAMLAGNPALGIIPDPTAGLCPVNTDQRGYLLPSTAIACDAGALEHDGVPPQTIAFTSAAPSTANAGGTTYTPTATATSGLPVAITIGSSSSTTCSISAGIISFLSAGTCVVNANQGGDASWATAVTASQTITVAPMVPSPVIPAPPAPPAGATQSQGAWSGSTSGTATAALGDGSLSVVGWGRSALTVSQYADNPTAGAVHGGTGLYYDVELAQPSGFSTVVITMCALGPEGQFVSWWDGNDWELFSEQSYNAATKCTAATVTSTSAPSVFQLSGTPVAPSSAAASVIAPAVSTTSPAGYWVVARDGGVSSYGATPVDGSLVGTSPGAPVVGAASSADGKGYWEVTASGGTFALGDAHFYGSVSDLHLNAPVVGVAADPKGDGYWEVAADGGVFAFGGAHFSGSLGGQRVTAPVVAIASTPDGGGYWVVEANGSVHPFGDALLHGSVSALHLDQPIVGIVPTADGGGYWLVARDGGVFALGDAHFYGSMGGRHLNQPVVAIAPVDNGDGYWLVAKDGAVFCFGDAHFYGSVAAQHVGQPIVAAAAAK